MTRSNDSELVSLPVVGCQFQQYIHQDYQLLERVARLATWSSLFRAGPQFQSYFGQVWCTVHNGQASCRWVTWWFASVSQRLTSSSLYSHGIDILHLQTYGVFIDICLIYDDLGQNVACFFNVFDHALPMGREAWKRAISKAFQRLIFTTKGSVTPFRKGWKGDAVGWAFVTGDDEYVYRKIGI